MRGHKDGTRRAFFKTSSAHDMFFEPLGKCSTFHNHLLLAKPTQNSISKLPKTHSVVHRFLQKKVSYSSNLI